jgi:hypothetical protein
LSHVLPLAINIPMTCPKRLALLGALFAALAVARPGFAGPHKGVVGKMLPATPVTISGKLLTYEGQPAADRQIHFENTVSGDAYLSRTVKDGSFSITLPPASYNLREEHGPIVAGDIQAWSGTVNLGTVSEPGTLEHFLESEGVAPALIHSPAPVTSDVRPGNPMELGNPAPSPDPHQ